MATWTLRRSDSIQISRCNKDEYQYGFFTYPYSRSENIRISRDDTKDLESYQALEKLYKKKTENMFLRIMKTRKRNHEYNKCNKNQSQSSRELDMTLHHSLSCPAIQHIDFNTYDFDSSGSSHRSHSFNALSIPSPTIQQQRFRRCRSRPTLAEEMLFHLDL